jgi:hypothetical protein
VETEEEMADSAEVNKPRGGWRKRMIRRWYDANHELVSEDYKDFEKFYVTVNKRITDTLRREKIRADQQLAFLLGGSDPVACDWCGQVCRGVAGVSAHKPNCPQRSRAAYVSGPGTTKALGGGHRIMVSHNNGAIAQWYHDGKFRTIQPTYDPDSKSSKDGAEGNPGESPSATDRSSTHAHLRLLEDPTLQEEHCIP